MPLSRVRVIAPDPGGGFGGKQHAKFEPLVAFLALRAGRPVRLVLSLEETFQAVRRAACEVHVRTGVNRDGGLVFEDVRADYLIGAYADIADRVVGKGSYVGAGPYTVPAARIRARSILSHTTPSTAFRGFGNPQINWAVESNLDEAARAIGMDRLAIRLRNLARKGDAFIPFDTPADGDWAQAVRQAARADRLGHAAARGSRPGHRARHQVRPDHRPLVLHGPAARGRQRRRLRGHVRHGPGGADGLRPDRGRRARRAAGLGDRGDGGHVGRPVRPADVGQPVDRADGQCRAGVLPRDPGQAAGHGRPRSTASTKASITVEHGVVRLPDREVTVLEILRPGLGRLGGELVGNGEGRKEAEPGHPLGGAPAFFEFNCTAVEAAVDRETGDITLVRHVTVSDVGKALNPLQVRMQDEGAAIMGLGHTLMEHYIYDERGRIRNLGAIDYRIPTSMDLPLELVSETVENADGPGPYGSKGMSEGALLCTAAAVAGAVREATGVTIRDLPLTPERVWRALRDQRPA